MDNKFKVINYKGKAYIQGFMCFLATLLILDYTTDYSTVVILSLISWVVVSQLTRLAIAPFMKDKNLK